jgi:hypothetical protein
MMFTVQAYQTSQYMVPRKGIFLGKWRCSFAGSSDGKMNTRYYVGLYSCGYEEFQLLGYNVV